MTTYTFSPTEHWATEGVSSWSIDRWVGESTQFCTVDGWSAWFDLESTNNQVELTITLDDPLYGDVLGSFWIQCDGYTGYFLYGDIAQELRGTGTVTLTIPFSSSGGESSSYFYSSDGPTVSWDNRGPLRRIVNIGVWLGSRDGNWNLRRGSISGAVTLTGRGGMVPPQWVLGSLFSPLNDSKLSVMVGPAQAPKQALASLPSPLTTSALSVRAEQEDLHPSHILALVPAFVEGNWSAEDINWIDGAIFYDGDYGGCDGACKYQLTTSSPTRLLVGEPAAAIEFYLTTSATLDLNSLAYQAPAFSVSANTEGGCLPGVEPVFWFFENTSPDPSWSALPPIAANPGTVRVTVPLVDGQPVLFDGVPWSGGVMRQSGTLTENQHVTNFGLWYGQRDTSVNDQCPRSPYDEESVGAYINRCWSLRGALPTAGTVNLPSPLGTIYGLVNISPSTVLDLNSVISVGETMSISALSANYNLGTALAYSGESVAAVSLTIAVALENVDNRAGMSIELNIQLNPIFFTDTVTMGENLLFDLVIRPPKEIELEYGFGESLSPVPLRTNSIFSNVSFFGGEFLDANSLQFSPACVFLDDFSSGELNPNTWTTFVSNASRANVAIVSGRAVCSLTSTWATASIISKTYLRNIRGKDVIKFNWTPGRHYASAYAVPYIAVIPELAPSRESTYGYPLETLIVFLGKQYDTSTRSEIRLGISKAIGLVSSGITVSGLTFNAGTEYAVKLEINWGSNTRLYIGGALIGEILTPISFIENYWRVEFANSGYATTDCREYFDNIEFCVETDKLIVASGYFGETLKIDNTVGLLTSVAFSAAMYDGFGADVRIKEIDVLAYDGISSVLTALTTEGEFLKFLEPDEILENEYSLDGGEGMTIETLPYTHQIKARHSYPAIYEIVEGEIPEGLTLTPTGTISGIVENMDAVESNADLPPSAGWYDQNAISGEYHSWSRPYRFKVRCWIPEISGCEMFSWFVIRVHNNWDLDRDLLLSLMPMESVVTEVIEEIEEEFTLPDYVL